MTRLGVIFLICLAVAGCTSPEEEKHPARKVLSKSDYQALRQEFKAPTGGTVQHRGYPIKQGTPPLAVLVPAENTVRVIDATNGQLIASGSTERDAVVSVDAKSGVTLGREKLAAGPLGSTVSYAIYIESTPTDLTIRSGAGARVPTATTAPAR